MKIKIFRGNRLLSEEDVNLLADYMIPVKYCGWSLIKCRICGCKFHSGSVALSHLKNYHKLKTWSEKHA